MLEQRGEVAAHRSDLMNQSYRPSRYIGVFAILFISLALVLPFAPARTTLARSASTYTNPLAPTIPGNGVVESCADPSIIYNQAPDDTAWYMYCTTDPLNDADRDANGNFVFHLIPIVRSVDLVNWTYIGDAVSARPDWIADDVGMWAPDVHFFNGQYYLYYTAPWTDLPGGGSAIGVLTAPTPAGPWVDSGGPVVEPHNADCCADRRWVFDASVVTDDSGQKWIYYGSYFGGISVRRLSASGLHSDPATQQNVTIANRYEGAFVMRHGGYYYLFASATDCCRGPLTGYSVFVGRSVSPTGPFVDREGVSLLAGQVGGTPVISMNGNRWVGPGHNTVFTDFAGQDWFLYHAIDRNDPYFAGTNDFTRRPALLDALDWVDGWPTVRGGQWASDTPEHAPAAQPGLTTRYKYRAVKEHELGRLLAEHSDEFEGDVLGDQWQWVAGRVPAAGTFGVEGGSFRFDTQDADLFRDNNSAAVLGTPAPRGNYAVEAKVTLNLPPEGCCFNFRQAGLVIYGDDDHYVKLVHVSIWETRQTEFAKEYVHPFHGAFYGNTVVGPPGLTTWLRITKRTVAGEEHYTAYTSRDGITWVRGGTWTHDLGNDARIGLVSLGGSGFVAQFDYVRVYRLHS
jgi:arabinan endo-1,5-alpha-L-arabinosidase